MFSISSWKRHPGERFQLSWIAWNRFHVEYTSIAPLSRSATHIRRGSSTLLTQLDVATTRRWINSWSGAPTSLHNQHQRLIAFFNFCIEQGWIKDNPAKKIKRFHGSRRKRCPSPANNMRPSLRPPTTTTPAESSATARRRIPISVRCLPPLQGQSVSSRAP